MSAGLPPPRSILAHAHWTMGRSKMSKSRGNVVDPIGAMDTYGVDGARWYLLRVGGSLPDDAGQSMLSSWLDFSPTGSPLLFADPALTIA